MKMVSYNFFILGVLLLTGCSNSPVNPTQAKFTKPQNVLAYNSPANNTARVTLYRDSGIVSAGCDVITSVNGKRSLILASGEKGVLYVPQGTVSFTSQLDCPIGNGRKSAALNIFLTKNVPVYLRVQTDQASGVYIKETTADNPDFVCLDPSKGLDARLNGSKDNFVEAMRTYASFFESLRDSARTASVSYNYEGFQECLTKNSAQVKKRMDIAFKTLRDNTKNEEEKSSLIDAYSKFLATIDSSMSINQINTIQAPFKAAVNKYELY